VAIRVAGGRVVARAEGYGACHVVTKTELAGAERETRGGQ
jgi:hypothetical protein